MKIEFIQFELAKNLTARSRAVIALRQQGLSDQEIAEECYIRPGTVRTHVANISKKLEISCQQVKYCVLLPDPTSEE